LSMGGQAAHRRGPGQRRMGTTMVAVRSSPSRENGRGLRHRSITKTAPYRGSRWPRGCGCFMRDTHEE